METVKTRQEVIKMIRPTPNDMDDEKIVYSAYIRAESSRMALKGEKNDDRDSNPIILEVPVTIICMETNERSTNSEKPADPSVATIKKKIEDLILSDHKKKPEGRIEDFILIRLF